MQTLANYMRHSDEILVFTGAGISTGSGIKDFRGPDGIWKTHQPVYYQDFLSSKNARIKHLGLQARNMDVIPRRQTQSRPLRHR